MCKLLGTKMHIRCKLRALPAGITHGGESCCTCPHTTSSTRDFTRALTHKHTNKTHSIWAPCAAAARLRSLLYSVAASRRQARALAVLDEAARHAKVLLRRLDGLAVLVVGQEGVVARGVAPEELRRLAGGHLLQLRLRAGIRLRAHERWLRRLVGHCVTAL